MRLSASRRSCTVLLTSCLIWLYPARPACGRAARPAEPAGEVNQAYLREHLHQVRIPDPHARRREALHRRLRPQGQSGTLSDPADAHAIRRRPYGVDRLPGPRPVRCAVSRRSGSSSPSRTCAAATDSEGTVRRHAARNARRMQGPKDIDESTDTYDTIDWLVKNVPNNNGKVGLIGHLLPRLLHRGRHDRRAPGAEVRLAAGADRRTGSSATTSTTTARSVCRTPSTSSPASARSSRTRSASRPRPFDYKTPDGYEFFLKMGPLANADESLLQGQDRLLERRDGPRHLRRVLAVAQPPAAPEEHQAAVMTVGGWFDAEDLFGALDTYRAVEAQTDPGSVQHPGHGPVAARRVGSAATATASGNVGFSAKTADFYREHIELPFFESLPEGRGRSSTCPRRGSSRPAPTSGASYDAWPPKDAAERSLYLRAGRQAVVRAARRAGRGRLRRIRQRPGQAGPLHSQHRDRHDPRVHDRRPALRRVAARRAGLPDGRRWRRISRSPARSRRT